jgi:GR25 family glycosyltransferase involved in LPS biosynthesis
MKTLNDYFTKIYVINLDRRPDRYQECQIEFNKIGINVERIPGIDGKEMPNTWGLTPREKACFAVTTVHRNLLSKALLNNYPNILIFEDDVVFIDNFNEIFNERIKSLPEDWNLLLIGGNHILHVNGFDLITGDKNFKVTKENYRTLNYELSKSPCTYCTHAIAINSRSYEKTISKMKQFPTDPTDNLYYQLQMEGCNAYTFLPSLAKQKAGFSDVDNIYVDYDSMPQVSF